MHTKKILVILFLIFAVVFLGCKEKEKSGFFAESQEKKITKNLIPSDIDVEGKNFQINLNNIQTLIIEDISSKEVKETPGLYARIKITNKSKDVLDVQAITFEYMDETGNIINFESGEKSANAHVYMKVLQPSKSYEGQLNVDIPKKAVLGKKLSKIEINAVYALTPLERETFTVSGKLESQ